MKPATILLVHNFYRQPGGEDGIFAEEQALLRAHGHRVITYSRTNASISDGFDARAAAATFWNVTSYREISRLIRTEHVDVMHCHNTFPLISPAAYWAARARGVAVVQTIHNYRLACAGATFYRDGEVCEECVESRSPLPAIRHRCYRGSLAATTILCAMTGVHRALGTYADQVTLYIALNEFMRSKLVEAGIAPDRIRVKPNSVQPDPGPGEGDGGYALFIGRLSQEKGLDLLCRAWRRAPALPKLVLVGDGPSRQLVEQAALADARIRRAGRVSDAEKLELLRHARFLVTPSLWYEGFPKVIQEAYALALPVLVSRLGGLEEAVQEELSGLCFAPGDEADLARQAARLAGDDELIARLRRGARREYETRYTAEKNYTALAHIYSEAIDRSRGAQLPG
jgi:glycosyltransferase involved in cell wall biosynthesis